MMAMILRRYLPRWYVSCTGCRYSSQASRRGVSTDVWILESECKISLICGHGKKKKFKEPLSHANHTLLKTQFQNLVYQFSGLLGVGLF